MPDILMTDLSSRLETAEVRALLLALGYPPVIAATRADSMIAEYQANPRLPILGAEHSGEQVGLIGLRIEDGTAVIRHIVVQPAWRGRGVGSAMIRAVCEQVALRRLTAETDRDAVAFYRRCGFEVESLGRLYPGTERFRCVLTR